MLLLWASIGGLLTFVKRVPRVITIAGQHSLLIYVSHIVVLYGSAWMPGLRQMFGKTLELGPVLAIITILLITTSWAAMTVHQMKQERSLTYRYLPYAAAVLLLTVLMFA